MKKLFSRINSKNFITLLFFLINFPTISNAKNSENLIGKKIFELNCNVCHLNGTNIIIPEKNLKKETLTTNGMNNVTSIVYQITNGKNGMPAFGGRLTQEEIDKVAKYVLNDESFNVKN